MNNLQSALRLAAAALAGLCTAAFGGADIWLRSLLLFILLDYISGFLAAFITKQLSSDIGTRGLAKKILILLIIALANKLDLALALAGSLRSTVIGFYVANEGLSIFENVARAGVPVPKALASALDILNEEPEKETKNGTD